MSALYPIAFIDPPIVLTTGVTAIPADTSSPLQIVANLGAKAAYAIDFIDTTGDFIGVYQGASGSEVLRCVIGGGQTSRVWTVLTSFSRISLRSMTATAVTNGDIAITFMGYP